MDTRFGLGLGTAAIALLLLPLGYQLYTSTAISPLPWTAQAPAGRLEAMPAPPMREERADAEADAVTMHEAAPAATAAKAIGGADTAARLAAPLMGAAEAPAPAVPQGAALPPQTFAGPANGDQFTHFDDSPLKLVAEEPVSTFSVDVDTASYAYVRRALTGGTLPGPDAVRIEEMLNYFDYRYPAAVSPEEPLRPTMQVYPTPWNAHTQLLQVGITGYVPPAGEDKAANLTFLIDTSGSMDEPDKLPLLKRAFALLVDQLTGNDTVAIVAYAGSAGVVLEPTRATEKAKILAALETLSAGGSTAGAQGIELAYRLAARNKIEGGVNRVLLATDGDFNVGIDHPGDLATFIRSRRDEGIFLSVLGFGQGNYGDDTMQALAQNGNGIAAYVDSFNEARKVLVEQIGGTLETIATDVKIQVEFNPAAVAEYRLIGYETRALKRADFNNDRVDSGDVGAGHTVTALYEITPVGAGGALVDPLRYGPARPAAPASGASDEYGFLKLRFKLPGADTSRLIEAPIARGIAVDTLAAATDDARWAAAVAAFGQKLKGSSYGATMSWGEIETLARGARGRDENGWRAEFVQLVGIAAALAPER